MSVAANDSLANIEADIGDFRSEAAFVDGEAKLSETSGAYDDEASQALQALAETSARSLAKLDESLEGVRESCQQLLAWYAGGTCRKPNEVSDQMQSLVKTLATTVRKLLADGIGKLSDGKVPVQALPAPEGLFKSIARKAVVCEKSAGKCEAYAAVDRPGGPTTLGPARLPPSPQRRKGQLTSLVLSRSEAEMQMNPAQLFVYA